MSHPMRTQHEPVHVIPVGAFGEAVATTLQELLPDVIQTGVDARNQSFPATWPVARVNVLVSWRPVPALHHLLDGISYAWKRPSITAVLEAPLLRIGPVVIPGTGPCYGCYERRFSQHSARQSVYREQNAYYDQHPESGPRGYLPALARIAAVRLAQTIAQVDREPASVAGVVWHMNTLNRYTFATQVVGVHACPRCGLKRDETTRSYLDMQRDLADFFYLTAENALYQPVLESPITDESHASAAISQNGHGGTTW